MRLRRRCGTRVQYSAVPVPLTQKEIESAKSNGKTLRWWDSQGLYLEVSPAGGKWWRLKFRFGGKEKRMSLGTFPDVRLKAARRKRDEVSRACPRSKKRPHTAAFLRKS